MIEFSQTSNKQLLKLIAAYRKPVLKKSIWQILNTVVPYLMLWALMIWVSTISWWLVLPLAVLASGFAIRAFIIFHDCGHGSFFKSEYTSDMVGFVMGMIVLTPYYRWHNAHRIHHVTAGNLEKRGTGDVWTMTIKEYWQSTPKKRLIYRLYRNPIIMFLIGGPIIFLVLNRFTRKDFTWTERYSVYATNAGILAFALTAIAVGGLIPYLIIQILTMYFAAVIGVYLFYVQHQFDDVHWYDDENWDYNKVAIAGSSYFKLPKVLQWFSGNIGFHHIHHLSSGIPNYNLEKCYRENKIFQEVEAITFWKSFKTLRLKLWDEYSQKLVTYKEASKVWSIGSATL